MGCVSSGFAKARKSPCLTVRGTVTFAKLRSWAGDVIRLAVLHKDFVEELPYVDFVTDFRPVRRPAVFPRHGGVPDLA